ncbi:class I SAM-dependent methyltransferase [Nocardia goodfellowii]|uniref:SAM-dependent methyltransferase n=1 Tax=Nocardia goodfellowii TaxID=882446 RepID=A0ABS4QNV6_9NOCA|nr:class I SAM-dependent methyltransferase [Nocardia goodfellowii]MBP2193396.1 SAM-dependent methyltransferase [Nocardia goodfellowii]
MVDVREMWRAKAFGQVWAAAYDAVVEREALARPAGWALWGTDVGSLYRSMAFLGELPDGTAVLDVPCGGGVALRGLRTGQRLRYVATDISAAMLERTRARARRQGVEGLEVVEADIEAMPFADNEFDVCVSYNGLHCLPDPAAALREITRCLRPGGRLVGSCVVRGAGVRSEAFQVLARRVGMFGHSGSREDIARWMTGAGLTIERFDCSGPILYFAARRAGAVEHTGP